MNEWILFFCWEDTAAISVYVVLSSSSSGLREKPLGGRRGREGKGGKPGNVFQQIWTDWNVFRQVSTGLNGLKRVSTGSNVFQQVWTDCGVFQRVPPNRDTPRMFVDVSLKNFFVKNDIKKRHSKSKLTIYWAMILYVPLYL